MGYDLKQAFTFIWSDADFFTKWAIGSFILVFPTLPEWFPGIKRLFKDPANWGWLCVFLLIALIVHLSIKGYFYKAVHNNVVHDAQKLPAWKDFWIYTKNGLKAYVGATLFALPFALVGGLGIWLFQPDVKSPLFIGLFIAALLIFGVIYLPFSLNFATRLRIRAFFSVKRAIWLVKGRAKDFISLYTYCVAIYIIAVLVSAILSMYGLTSLLLPFFAFYIVMVYADLYAQFLNMPSKSESKPL